MTEFKKIRRGEIKKKKSLNRIIAIIQARVGSTRLPGKVLMQIGERTMLAQVARRVQRATTLDAVIIATTKRPRDNAILAEATRLGITVFQGNEDDVLDRYYQVAAVYKGDVIVRITSDCPLIDPEIIDKVVNEFVCYYPKVDYVCNVLPRTFPRGLDVEVMSFEALEKAWQEDNNPAWREHVTPYIQRHPEIFRIRNVASEVDYSYMRWTVDTPKDLIFVRKIYEHFKNDTFSWRDVLHLLELHPEWLEINRHIQQKVVP